MNSLLIKAGIPQLRVSAVAGGRSPCRFVYEAKIPGGESFNNYQYDLPRVDVESFWRKFNALGGAMHPSEFIRKNVVNQLLADGYPNDLAISGARKAVEHYQACSQASKKGAMYDDCLYMARQHAWMNTTKRDQIKKPVKSVRKRAKQVGGLIG